MGSADICGVILDEILGDPLAHLALTRTSNSMNQPSAPDPSSSAGSATPKEPVAGTAADEASAEPPAVERSRFSQWLASFGLGEFQNPLLTRARPPVTPRRPASQ
jgi:hypothetical protein